MTNIKRCLLIFTILSLANAQAQDKVVLKNGSIIYGKVTSVINDKLSIEYAENEILEFEVNQLQHLKIKDAKLRESETFDLTLLKRINKVKFRQGIKTMVQAGILLSDVPDANFTFSATATYRISQYAQFGLGTGYDVYRQFHAMPIYLYYQADLMAGSESPFVYGAFGHSFVKEREDFDDAINDLESGKVLQVGLGHRLIIDRKSLIFTLGWRQQHVSYDNTPVWWIDQEGYSSTIKRQMNRMEIKIGMMF